MRKYREALEAENKTNHYQRLIDQKKDDGTFDKIKKAENLRGKITIRPTNPEKVVALEAYKSLEPILY